MPSTPKIETVDRQWAPALCRADTWNEDERSVEVVFATETPVQREHWRDGRFLEVLEVSRAAIDTARLEAGAPVLASHRAYDLGAVLGAVVPGSVKIGRGQATARIRFSARPEVAGIVQDVRDRILTNVSVGYAIEKSTKSDGRDGALPTVRATRWTPLEISMVPIGADPNAKTRNGTMPEPIETEDGRQPEPAAPVFGARQRREIAARAFKNDPAEADQFYRDHARLGERAYRDAILDAIVERQEQAPTFPVVDTRGMHDRATNMRAAMVDALTHRINPALVPELSADARDFRHSSLLDLARHVVESNGTTTRGWSKHELVTRALHSTSDFPILLTESARRTLLAGYTAARSGVHQMARQVTAVDFRPISRVRVTDELDLERVNEHGEFKRGTMREGKEAYSLGTFGKIFGLTRQAIVNDDLGAFSDLAAVYGRSAARFEDTHLTNLIESNPEMADEVPMFDTAHGNAAASGSALSLTNLKPAWKALRAQTDAAGRPISVTPRFLMVHAGMEIDAMQMLAQIEATKTEDVNPFAGRLTVVANPYMADENAWYLAAAPGELHAMEYAYLAGNEGPIVDVKEGWDVDGVEWKVRLDFGAGFIDTRGWYYNAGADA